MTTTSSFPVRNPLKNALLREAERVSPATSLDLVIGYEADGQPIYCCLAVGQLILSPMGRGYRVIGFSLDNHVFAQPYGLGTDPLVRFIEIENIEGITFLDDPIMGSYSLEV